MLTPSLTEKTYKDRNMYVEVHRKIERRQKNVYGSNQIWKGDKEKSKPNINNYSFLLKS